MKVLVILAVRNEAPYLKVLLPYLFEQNVHIHIIDNDSTDKSQQIFANYSSEYLTTEKLPFKGQFSLKEQLSKKQEVVLNSDADWIIHHDADEILQSTKPGENLRDLITRVDNLGFNAINFLEYVFLPENELVDYAGSNYLQSMHHYYFFEPKKTRLIRAYKRNVNLENVSSGGHILRGEGLNLYESNMSLRHYICLSLDRLRRKYGERTFSNEELARGWHRNRVNRDWQKVTFPNLSLMTDVTKKGLSTDNPYNKHFWSWDD